MILSTTVIYRLFVFEDISLPDATTTKSSSHNNNNNNNNNHNNNEEKNHTSSCPVPPLDRRDFASDLEFYRAVHASPFPSCAAGSWVYRPAERIVLSAAHLQCLDGERQGNCHDPNAWKYTNDTAKLSRHKSLLANGVRNSPGILNASDPWVWESSSEPYRVMDRRDVERYRARIQQLFAAPSTRVFLVGDSLTRQWQHAMKCELEHVVGMERVAERIVYLQMHTGFERRVKKRFGIPFWFSPNPFGDDTTEDDYVVFNFGHHTGHKLGNDWPQKYVEILQHAFAIDYGNIPDEHIFFRTTTVRHFLANQGDWNTEHSQAGGIAPDATAQWNWYGGNKPEQPQQNQIALDVILGRRRTPLTRRRKQHHFQILDTSPMTLSRADSSFDGSHLCLPGPMEFWSRMLFHRMEVLQRRRRSQKHE